jgi:hypothetical protein
MGMTMFPPFVPTKNYSAGEIENFLDGVEEDIDKLIIHGYYGLPLRGNMYSLGYFSYDSTRWRALCIRADKIVRYRYEREDGEIMFVDYWDLPGSRWILQRKPKPIRW